MKLLRFTKHKVVKPVYHLGRRIIVVNVDLWGRTFWQEWESLAWDKKLVWLFFINQLIAIITLVEFLVFGKR